LGTGRIFSTNLMIIMNSF